MGLVSVSLAFSTQAGLCRERKHNTLFYQENFYQIYDDWSRKLTWFFRWIWVCFRSLDLWMKKAGVTVCERSSSPVETCLQLYVYEQIRDTAMLSLQLLHATTNLCVSLYLIEKQISWSLWSKKKVFEMQCSQETLYYQLNLDLDHFKTN